MGDFILILICFVVGGIGILIYLHESNKQLKKYDNDIKEKEQCENEAKIKYINWLSQNRIVIPNDTIEIGSFYDATNPARIDPILFWKKDTSIFVCVSPETIAKKARMKQDKGVKPEDIDVSSEYYYEILTISNIKFYKLEGQLTTSTHVTGGQVSGGGTSIKGAVVGGVLAGDVGAVLGSRKKVESTPIKSHTVYNDDRVVNMYLDNDGEVVVKEYPYAYYDAFKQLIPDKNYDYIVVNQKL